MDVIGWQIRAYKVLAKWQHLLGQRLSCLILGRECAQLLFALLFAFCFSLFAFCFSYFARASQVLPLVFVRTRDPSCVEFVYPILSAAGVHEALKLFQPNP